MNVAGKVAIVTGGARGFGKGFCEAILKRGGKVCFVDTNEEVAKQTLQEFGKNFGDKSAMFVKCDVTNEAEFKGVFKAAKERFGNIHIMINNAGILNENIWERMININLVAVMRGTNLAIEYMRKDKGGEGGLIMNVASIAAMYPAYHVPAYVATKHGVLGFTRSWASNPYIKDYGISFVSLCPAFSETQMLTDSIDMETPPILYPETKEEFRRQSIGKTGLNSIQDVVDAFTEVLEKPNNNGDVLLVDKRRGIQYMFQKTPKPQKL